VFAYTRTLGGVEWLVCSNFGADPIEVTLPVATANLIISNYEDYPVTLGRIMLRAYEAFIVVLDSLHNY